MAESFIGEIKMEHVYTTLEKRVTNVTIFLVGYFKDG